MEQRVSFITLGVAELERSKNFYCALGWKTANENDDGIVVYNLQQMAIALYQVDNLAKDAQVDMQREAYPKFTLAYNVESENEVETILLDAQKAGAQIIKSAQKVFWGGYSGYFADPDNFLWEVAYNPYAKLGDNGEFQWGN